MLTTMGLHPRLAEAFEQIDAAVFNGDTFHDPDHRENFIDYLNRWSRELATSEMTNAAIVADLQSPKTEHQRPAEEQRLLVEAFEHAKTIMDDDTGRVSEREGMLAQAYLLLVGDLACAFAMWRTYDPNRPTKCGWCIHAHGNTQEAWDSLPFFESGDAIREHTSSCFNNPVVVALRHAIDAVLANPVETECGTIIVSQARLDEWIALVKPRHPPATRPSATLEYLP